MTTYKEVIGFVTPKYLDQHWFTSFHVNYEQKTKQDIPVKIIFEEKTYIASMVNNDMKNYDELLEEIKQRDSMLEYLGYNHEGINYKEEYYKLKSIVENKNDRT